MELPILQWRKRQIRAVIVLGTRFSSTQTIFVYLSWKQLKEMVVWCWSYWSLSGSHGVCTRVDGPSWQACQRLLMDVVIVRHNRSISCRAAFVFHRLEELEQISCAHHLLHQRLLLRRRHWLAIAIFPRSSRRNCVQKGWYNETRRARVRTEKSWSRAGDPAARDRNAFRVNIFYGPPQRHIFCYTQ